jgi:thioredoxin-related protein
MKRYWLLILMGISLIVSAQKAPVKNHSKTNVDFPSNGNSGIQWLEGLSWREILKRAKDENKCIFIDCYATWCAPCKIMDRKIYTNDSVGKYFNNNFLCIKVQMDQTTFDDDTIKRWYEDARRMQKDFVVTAFPTYLFFFPDGKPMHKAVGSKTVTEFIRVGKEALDPQIQYYAILNNYYPGKFDTAELKALALTFRTSGNQLASKMAAEYFSRIPRSDWSTKDNLGFMMRFPESIEIQKIALEYLTGLAGEDFIQDDNSYLISYFKTVPQVKELVLNYLNSLHNSALKKYLSLLYRFASDRKAKEIANKYIWTLPTDDLYTKETLQLLATFTHSTKDTGFQIFYKQSEKVNKAIGSSDYAQTAVANIIMKEEYDQYWNHAIETESDNIPWTNVFNKVRNKYGKSMAEEIDLLVKVSLYEYLAQKKNKNWSEYIKYNISKIERFGTDTTNAFVDATVLNNFAYSAIFLHSDDPKEVNKAIKWMEDVIRRNPKDANHIDTYANLLYKSGRVNEAINWQERAIQTAIEQKQDWDLKSLQNNHSKMKKGEATW